MAAAQNEDLVFGTSSVDPALGFILPGVCLVPQPRPDHLCCSRLWASFQGLPAQITMRTLHVSVLSAQLLAQPQWCLTRLAQPCSPQWLWLCGTPQSSRGHLPVFSNHTVPVSRVDPESTVNAKSKVVLAGSNCQADPQHALRK